MANEILKEIGALVEREAIMFCQEARRREPWKAAGQYRRCRAGHLFGVCMALKAIWSDAVTAGERQHVAVALQGDIRANCFGGNREITERWMEAALQDAATGKFRPQLVAPYVERLFCGKPKKALPAPQPPSLRVIQGGKEKKGGRHETTRPAAKQAAR